MKAQKGFTAIELVTVIILLGIFAAFVAPKFSGSDDFEAYAFRTQLVSDLRLIQQRAMHQTDCVKHPLVFDGANSRYGVPDRTDCNVVTFPSGWVPDKVGLIISDEYDVSIFLGGSNSFIVSFDSMGRPGDDCDGGCTIQVESGVETIEIAIESEGYVHAI